MKQITFYMSLYVSVEIVKKMDYGLDLLELTMMQDQLFDIFRTSLPFMKKAYDLNPKRRETMIGLEGIYFSMNDVEKSELFKKKINYGLVCTNSKIQFKMVIDSASSEPFTTMSQKEADEWDDRQDQLRE